MMPVAQLDPASLTIWYDPEHVHGGSNKEALAEAVNHAFNGDDDAAVATIREIDHEADKVHGINLVSSIWHERRHFLDLLLTNYGSFRMRQFIQLYANCHVWGEFARSGKPIACPIDLYLDSVRCEVLGVEQPSEEVLKLAKEIAGRKGMHADDTRIVQTQFGPLNIGGEAQLEALAYHSQFIAIQERFGLDLSLLIQRRTRMLDSGQRKYNWANLMFLESGLASCRDLGGIQVIDYSCLFPLLFASLANRRFGQEQVYNEKGGSGFAAFRLSALLHHIKDNKIDFKCLTGEQSWQRTNEIAEQLWGRSILEEIEEDYRRETVFFEQINGPGLIPAIGRWLKDVHRLRGMLLQLLKTNPSSVIDPVRFSAELLPKLQPAVINTQKSGVLGKPSPPFERVFGYKDPEDTGPESEWWWAITSRKRQTLSFGERFWRAVVKRTPESNPAVYKLEDFDASMEVVSLHAPFAKMLLNGRRHRTMLGPEILHIQMTLLNQGLKIQFDPLFAFPDEETDPLPAFNRRPNGEANCDLCHETITIDTSILVSPWVFRYNNKIAEFCIEAYGGGKAGQLRFYRDWSPWLMCMKCVDRLGFKQHLHRIS